MYSFFTANLSKLFLIISIAITLGSCSASTGDNPVISRVLIPVDNKSVLLIQETNSGGYPLHYSASVEDVILFSKKYEPPGGWLRNNLSSSPATETIKTELNGKVLVFKIGVNQKPWATFEPYISVIYNGQQIGTYIVN